MTVLKYIPEEETGFTGSVSIEIPFYKDRLKILRDSKFHEMSELDAVPVAFELVEKYVKSVELKFGEHEFSTLDELGCYEEGGELIKKILAAFIKGIPLGNSSKRLSPDR